MKNKVDYSLYLVTNRQNKTEQEFLRVIEESILGGITVLQLREKYASAREFYEIGKKVKRLTEKYDIPLIVNDRIDLAMAIESDGVHIGQNDIPRDVAKKIIKEDMILGVSAATVEDAKIAEENGADYIGSGAIFLTKTKKASCISIDYLKKIVNSVEIPVVAIGGINEFNINNLSKTKIKGISVVSAIMNNENPQMAAKNLKEEFKKL